MYAYLEPTFNTDIGTNPTEPSKDGLHTVVYCIPPNPDPSTI